MRIRESGAGTVKTILSVAFIVAVIYCAVKIVPVYVNSYELQDYIRQQTPFWLAQRASGQAIQDQILGKARELDLPVGVDEVKVEANRAFVSVSIDYTVPVDLIVYTLNLHFAPTAENRSLT